VKERIEAVALENAFLNGKITALTVSHMSSLYRVSIAFLPLVPTQSFRDLLGDALADGFPELSHLRQPSPSVQNPGNTNGDHGVTIKKEEN
jgi:hypothetical protein